MPSRSALLVDWGFTPSTPVSGTQSLAANAAATWYAFGFVPEVSKTINEFSLWTGTLGGSLGSSDVSLSVYDSDSNGKPNSSLTSSTTLAAAIASGAAARFTGLSAALTAGKQYWGVVKNLNGTPATNFPRIVAGAGAVLPQEWGGSAFVRGYGVGTTTNSGTAWSSSAVASSFCRVGWSDGTYEGFPVTAVAAGAVQNTSTAEIGNKFTSPTGATLNVTGLAFYAGITSAFAGNLRMRLYTGSTPALQATAGLVPSGLFNTTGQMWVASHFSSPVAIAPGTVVRATLGNDTTETWGPKGWEYTFDGDSNSTPLLPFNGTLGKTSYNGTSWTDTANVFYPFALLLDFGNELASSGGGGMLVHPGLLGGVA